MAETALDAPFSKTPVAAVSPATFDVREQVAGGVSHHKFRARCQFETSQAGQGRRLCAADGVGDASQDYGGGECFTGQAAGDQQVTGAVSNDKCGMRCQSEGLQPTQRARLRRGNRVVADERHSGGFGDTRSVGVSQQIARDVRYGEGGTCRQAEAGQTSQCGSLGGIRSVVGAGQRYACRAGNPGCIGG